MTQIENNKIMYETTCAQGNILYAVQQVLRSRLLEGRARAKAVKKKNKATATRRTQRTKTAL